MDRPLESSEARNAAQFAAVYAASRRRARQPPGAIPASLAPLSLDALVARCRPQAPAPQAEPAAQYRCRRSVVATLAGAGVRDADWQALMYPEERRAFTEKSAQNGGKDGGKSGGNSDDDCRYCDASRALDDAKGKQEVATTRHASIEIGFDPDTFVSSTRVTGLDVVVPSAQLAVLFERADPRNWARPGSEVFKRSESGVWTRDGWQGGRPWARPDRGQIYEIALTQINETTAFEIHNILDISGFRNDLDGRSAEEAGKAQSVTLAYRYALQQNLGSKLGFIWEPEGIDIDNGWYRAVATRAAPEDDWSVAISVEKRLRYTSTRTIPIEISAALNTMAPAFLSLFMHEMVYGVLKDLDGGDSAAPAASGKARSSRKSPAHRRKGSHGHY